MSQSGYVALEGCDILRETTLAYHVSYEDGEYWIPKSQISDADDYEVGDSDVTLMVTEFIAKEKGISPSE